jgi:IclR family transcriptional regulator, acetate operon repressor
MQVTEQEGLEGTATERQVNGFEPKARVQSALRAISILLTVSHSPDGLRVKDITEKLGLSRQVTYHLIHTLQSTGILRKNENNRYVLGLAAVAIAEGFHRQLAPPEHLGGRVRSVVDATGEAAYASGWVAGEVVALYTARGQSPVGAAQVPLGYSGFAHARAAGKLLLALADPVAVKTYLETHVLEPRTLRTITDHKALFEEFKRIRERGYAIDNEEFDEGLSCMAVPFEGLNGRFVLGISVPSSRFDQNFSQYLSALTDAARLNF